jgi:hypothetical protein
MKTKRNYRNNKKWHFKRISFTEKHNSKKLKKFESSFKMFYSFKFNHGAFGDSYINRQLKVV